MPYFFGTFPLTSGVATLVDIGGSGIAGCLIGNESGLTCLITMQGNNVTKSLYPGSVDFFPVAPGFNGIVQIVPSTQLSNISSWPGQYIQIDVYGANEQPSGVYPLQLARANNIGNSITTSAGVTADSVINDTSPAGTEFIEATVSGDTGSSISIKNNGVMTLGNAGRHGELTFTSGGDIFINGPGTIGGNIQFFSTLSSGLGFFIGGFTQLDGGAITTDGFGTITLTNGNQIPFSGPTSGTVTFTLMFNGTIKIMVANFQNYQNNTATRQTFTFPSSVIINGPSLWIATEIPGCQGFLSGVGNTINIITSLVAGGGGITNQNNINKNSIGYHQAANTDSLKDTANDATGAHTGQLIVIGF